LCGQGKTGWVSIRDVVVVAISDDANRGSCFDSMHTVVDFESSDSISSIADVLELRIRHVLVVELHGGALGRDDVDVVGEVVGGGKEHVGLRYCSTGTVRMSAGSPIGSHVQNPRSPHAQL
jgi:hypothetical protein